jgi:hypothetical protein
MIISTPKWILKESFNENEYTYAVCECTIFTSKGSFGHEFKKIKYPNNNFIRFKCSKCNKEIEIFNRI